MESTMTIEQLFAQLAEKLELAHNAKTASDGIVASIIESSVKKFCEKQTCKPLQDMLDKMKSLRRADMYYQAIVENLAAYMGLPITVAYNKKTKLHTCKFAYDNPEQAQEIVKGMETLCKEIAEGEKEDFWTIVKKEKENKKATNKKSDYEIVQDKLDNLAKTLTKRYNVPESKLVKLAKLVDSIIN